MEKKRWDMEEEIKNKKEAVKEVGDEIKGFRQKEVKILARQKQINWDLKKADLYKEKIVLDDKKRSLELQENKLAEEEEHLSSQFKKMDQEITQTIEKEKQIEAQVRAIENKEQTVGDKGQVKAQEKVRWQVEAKRRETEKIRWVLEGKRTEILRKLQEIKDDRVELSAETEKTEDKAEGIAIFLEYGLEQGEKMIAQKKRGNVIERVKPQPAPIAKKIPREKIPELNEQERQKQEQARIQAQVKETREQVQKEEDIKLAEIRKRAQSARSQTEYIKPKGPLSKDLILRKLTTLSPQEEAARKEFLARVAGKERVAFVAEKGTQNRSEVVFRPVVKQPPALEKLLIRLALLIIVLALLVVGSLWIYSALKSPDGNEPQEPAVNRPFIPDLPIVPIIPSPEGTSTDATSTIEIIIPEPEQEVDLIGTLGLIEINFSDLDEIPSLFKVVLENQENGNSFKQIIFRNNITKELASLKQFLEAFAVSMPLGITGELESKQATLFLYNTSEVSHFGFVVEVSSQTFTENEMLDWEASIGNDLAELSLVIADQNLVYLGDFKSVINKGKPFRYIDSNLPNFGICYSIINNYLIFTFSGEVIVKALDKIIQ